MFASDLSRTPAEREMDKQNRIASAAHALLELGGTEKQRNAATQAVRLAEHRLMLARRNVQRERAS